MARQTTDAEASRVFSHSPLSVIIEEPEPDSEHEKDPQPSQPSPPAPNPTATDFSEAEEAQQIAWFHTAYVSHNNLSIKDSFFVWHSDEYKLAQFHDSKEDLFHGILYTCIDDVKGRNMSELLSAFCQQIEIPGGLKGNIFDASGVLATHMFRHHNGTKFDNNGLPFGIRAIQSVDRLKQIQLINKKNEGKTIQSASFRGLVEIQKDEGMKERGLINFSILSVDQQNPWAFMIILDIKHKDYESIFEHYPADEFDMVAASACYIFTRAMRYINEPSNHSEVAVLARQIGRGEFGAATRELTADEVAPVMAANEVEKSEEVSAAMVSKTEKKKSKKSKKGKKAAEGGQEGGEGGSTQESTTLSSPKALPPSPSPPTPPPPATPAAMVSSPALSAPPAAAGPPAFSFLSEDNRLVCQKPDCTILANARHAGAVVCPRCTEYSFTRYCSLEHLLSDTRNHFTSGVCGTNQIVFQPVDDRDDDAFPASSLPVRAYVQESNAANTAGFPKRILERHRQALYRSIGADGDDINYYIFDDLDQIPVPDHVLHVMPHSVRQQNLQNARGKGTVCADIILPEGSETKERFNRVVDECLGLGYAAGTLRNADCLWMFTVIRDELRASGDWDLRMEEMVAVQMGFEFGWRLPTEERGHQ